MHIFKNYKTKIINIIFIFILYLYSIFVNQVTSIASSFYHYYMNKIKKLIN